MTLDEIISLEKTASSLKKIDTFIQKNYDNYPYYKALSYKAVVLDTIGRTADAFKLLYNVTPSFSSMEERSVVAICDAIIDISFNAERLDFAKKYINIKKDYLPPSMMKFYYFDRIRLAEVQRDKIEYKSSIISYLGDDLTEDERYYANSRLLKYYYDERDFEKYLEYVKVVIPYLEKNFMYFEITEINIEKLRITFESGNYPKTISDGKLIIEEDAISYDQRIALASILIYSYIKTNDYHRAMIIESKYEEYLSLASIKNALEFCRRSLELYEHVGHKVSMDIYKDKVTEYEKSLHHESKLKKVKQVKNDLIEPDSALNEIEVSLDDKKSNLVNTLVTKKYNEQSISIIYEKLAKVFKTINNTDMSMLFREVFRLSAIELTKIFPITDIIVLYYNQKYVGHHYKKERVYDKKFTFEEIENTLSFEAMNIEDEVYLNLDGSNARISKNLITQKPYNPIHYGYAVPIYSNDVAIGSIAFLSVKSFIDLDMAYESLRIIAESYNSRLLLEIKQKEFVQANNKLFFISDYMSSGIKEELDGYIHLNQKATDIFKIDSDINMTEFSKYIKNEDLSDYVETRNKVNNLMLMDCEARYHFKKDDRYIFIRERFYPMYDNGVIRILSLVDDLSDFERREKELEDIAYKNPITGLHTKAKLFNDITNILEQKKFSLAVIKVTDLDYYSDLYGSDFQNDLIKAIGNILNKIAEDDFKSFTYHLEKDVFAILYTEINDSRLALSRTKTRLAKLLLNANAINKRLHLLGYGGIFRCTKNMTISDPSKMLFYANEAMKMAEENQVSGNVLMFDNEKYKERVFEAQLVTHISECIDSNLMVVSYSQVVSIKENKVYSYLAKLNLVNYDVDDKTFTNVVLKRGLTEVIDKYLISNVIRELKSFYDVTKFHFKTTVKIDAITFNSNNFYDFIKSQMDFYHIPYPMLSLLIVGVNPDENLIKRFADLKIAVAATELDTFFNFNIKALYYNFRKYNLKAMEEIKKSCIDHEITFILDGVDSKEDYQLAVMNKENLIYGNFFKKALRIKDIIDSAKK